MFAIAPIPKISDLEGREKHQNYQAYKHRRAHIDGYIATEKKQHEPDEQGCKKRNKQFVRQRHWLSSGWSISSEDGLMPSAPSSREAKLMALLP